MAREWLASVEEFLEGEDAPGFRDLAGEGLSGDELDIGLEALLLPPSRTATAGGHETEAWALLALVVDWSIPPASGCKEPRWGGQSSAPATHATLWECPIAVRLRRPELAFDVLRVGGQVLLRALDEGRCPLPETAGGGNARAPLRVVFDERVTMVGGVSEPPEVMAPMAGDPIALDGEPELDQAVAEEIRRAIRQRLEAVGLEVVRERGRAAFLARWRVERRPAFEVRGRAGEARLVPLRMELLEIAAGLVHPVRDCADAEARRLIARAQLRPCYVVWRAVMLDGTPPAWFVRDLVLGTIPDFDREVLPWCRPRGGPPFM